MTHQDWVVEEDEFLRENYGKISISKMASKLGKTSSAINSRISNLLIRKKHTVNVWTKDEDKYLMEIYPNRYISIDEIAKHLGRTRASISARCSHLHLSRLRGERLKPKSFEMWAREKHPRIFIQYKRYKVKSLVPFNEAKNKAKIFRHKTRCEPITGKIEPTMKEIIKVYFETFCKNKPVPNVKGETV